MRDKIFLIGLLFLALLLRLYRIDNPIGDWHAFRQADTSAVSKQFVAQGFHIFTPTYFDISNIQSGFDNPNGYRMVEFPIYNIFQAGGYTVFKGVTLEVWGRLITIASSLLSITFIYFLTKKYSNSLTAIFSAFFFAVLPFSIYYGRVILPDPTAAMAILGGIYFFDRAISSKKINYAFFVISLIFTASSFLLKPFTIFFTLPMIYIAWKNFGLSFLKKWLLWVFLVVSFIPLTGWRLWISQFPEGVPVSSWLFNEGNIRFTGAYFYWIFADRIGKQISGYTGYFFLLLGFLKQNEKHFGFFLSFAVSSLIYLVVIARGNVQHDYYQVLILPTICLFLGRGVVALFSFLTRTFAQTTTNFLIVGGIFTMTVLSMLMFSWYHVRDYFNINNESLVVAGEIADKVLPRNARVIAANNGDTSFLYYINRKGWPAYQKGPRELAQMGATHIVIPNPTEADYSGLGSEFDVFYSSSQVLILNLTK